MDDVSEPRLATRILLGAIAGFAATVAMTSTMMRIHRELPRKERYPLPPREIAQALLPHSDDDGVVRDTAVVAHFLYGAATGALVGAVHPAPTVRQGAAAGVAIWAGSYLGWVPATGILKPASRHPPRRNALMIGAHLVWGGATALILRELLDARRTILNERAPRDRQRTPSE